MMFSLGILIISVWVPIIPAQFVVNRLLQMLGF